MMPRSRVTRTAVKPTGLVGHWRFDELGGLAFDYSGSGNHGNIVGATRVAGKNGGGLSFDGNDYVETPHNVSLALNQLTLALWIKTTDTSGYIIFKQQVSQFHGDYDLELVGDVLRFSVDTTEELIQLFYTDSGDVSDDVWHHAACTYDGSTMVGYFDGELIDSAEQTGNTLSNGDSLFLGVRYRDVGGYDDFLSGIIDDVRIYNYALSETEIQKIYNDTK